MDQLPHLRKCKYSSGENLLTQKLNKIKSVTFKLVFVPKKIQAEPIKPTVIINTKFVM